MPDVAPEKYPTGHQVGRLASDATGPNPPRPALQTTTTVDAPTIGEVETKCTAAAAATYRKRRKHFRKPPAAILHFLEFRTGFRRPAFADDAHHSVLGGAIY